MCTDHNCFIRLSYDLKNYSDRGGCLSPEGLQAGPLLRVRGKFWQHGKAKTARRIKREIVRRQNFNSLNSDK